MWGVGQPQAVRAADEAEQCSHCPTEQFHRFHHYRARQVSGLHGGNTLLRPPIPMLFSGAFDKARAFPGRTLRRCLREPTARHDVTDRTVRMFEDDWPGWSREE